MSAPSGQAPDPKRGRINQAGSAWDTDLCRADLDALKTLDKSAWNTIQAMIEESEEFGLGFSRHPHDYSSPMGKKIPKGTDFGGHNKPWIGELRVDGTVPAPVSGSSLVHRLYFGEPDAPADMILATRMGFKVRGDPNGFTEQTKHIIEAMRRLIRWCLESNPPTGWREQP